MKVLRLYMVGFKVRCMTGRKGEVEEPFIYTDEPEVQIWCTSSRLTKAPMFMLCSSFIVIHWG